LEKAPWWGGGEIFWGERDKKVKRAMDIYPKPEKEKTSSRDGNTKGLVT